MDQWCSAPSPGVPTASSPQSPPTLPSSSRRSPRRSSSATRTVSRSSLSGLILSRAPSITPSRSTPFQLRHSHQPVEHIVLERMENFRAILLGSPYRSDPSRSTTGSLLAAAGDDDGIKLVASIDSMISKVLKGHKGPVTNLSFNPSNEFLASVDSLGTVI